MKRDWLLRERLDKLKDQNVYEKFSRKIGKIRKDSKSDVKWEKGGKF